MAQTYDAIASYTFGSAASSYTFSSIAASWTDLILIGSGTAGSDFSLKLQFNSDTASNYSVTYLYGTGSGSGTSGRASNATGITGMGRVGSGSDVGTSIIQIANYSNSTTYKTVVGRGGTSGVITIVSVGLWRSTSAITSVTVASETGANMNSGTTLTLYGVKSA